MKKAFIIILSIILLLAILTVPVPSTPYEDDDTKVYTALTYRVVKWKKFTDSYKPYENTKIYYIPDNFASIDTLWEKEIDSWDGQFYGDESFTAIITDIWGTNGNFLIKDESKDGDIGDTVLSDDDNPIILKGGEKVAFSELKVGDRIKITYDGITYTVSPELLGKVYEIEILE